MNWRSKVDYHGYHSYGQEARPAGRLKPTIARLVDGTRHLLRKLQARSDPPTVLLHEGQHSFSLLGADSLAAHGSESAACPFPLKATPADRRDWRVLP